MNRSDVKEGKEVKTGRAGMRTVRGSGKCEGVVPAASSVLTASRKGAFGDM